MANIVALVQYTALVTAVILLWAYIAAATRSAFSRRSDRRQSVAAVAPAPQRD